MTNGDRGHYIGRRGDEHVYSRSGMHLLVCGPSQTGKTASLLAHAVRAASGPTVTTSTKEDLLNLPGQPGSQYVLDLMGHVEVPPGVGERRFSPLSLVGSFEDALLTGRTLMDSAYSFGRAGTTNEAYWTQRGARVLAALLWAAHRGDQTVAEVFQWAASQDTDSPLEHVAGSGPGDVRARHILAGLTVPDGDRGRRPSTQAAAVWSFAEQAVALYAYPAAAQRASGPNLDPDEFVRSSDTLHIVCPSSMAAELGPAVAVLIQALAEARYRLHAQSGRDGKVPPRLSLVLDEVANTAPLPSLPALCSEGAGQGVSLLLGTQDRAQLEDRFGTEQARTIVSNCRDRVLTAELGDRPFLEDIEALCGTRLREEISTTRSDAGQGRAESVTTSYQEVPLWRAWEIAQLGQLQRSSEFRALYLRGWEPHLVELVKYDPDEPAPPASRRER